MPIEDEGRAIDEVVDRLSTKYPSVPAADILRQVNALLAKFSDSAVRDFVPVLVEREAVKLLAEQVGRDSR